MEHIARESARFHIRQLNVRYVWLNWNGITMPRMKMRMLKPLKLCIHVFIVWFSVYMDFLYLDCIIHRISHSDDTMNIQLTNTRSSWLIQLNRFHHKFISITWNFQLYQNPFLLTGKESIFFRFRFQLKWVNLVEYVFTHLMMKRRKKKSDGIMKLHDETRVMINVLSMRFTNRWGLNSGAVMWIKWARWMALCVEDK